MDDQERPVSRESRPSRYRWVVLLSWMSAHVWGHTFIGSLGLLLPSISADMGLSPIQKGLLASAPPVANIFLAIPFGWLLSRFSPKLLTSISYFSTAALVFFQGWAPGYLILLLGRFLYGAGAIAREPARVLLIRQWIPQREIVIANAMANFLWGIVGVGYIFFPIVLKALDDDWRKTIYVFGGVSVLVAVAWQVLGKERITPEYQAQIRSQEGSPLGAIFRYKELRWLALGMLGMGINFSAFSTFWPSFRLEEYGMSLTAAAIVMAIGGLSSSFAGIGVGLLASKRGNKRQILYLSGLLLAGTSVGLLWGSSYPLLVLVFIIQSLGWAFFPITLTIPYELPGIKPREVAVAATTLFTVLWIGSFIGPLLAGALEEAYSDLRLALVVTSLAALFMTLGGFLLPRSWDRLRVEPRPRPA